MAHHIRGLEHVGIAVDDVERAAGVWRGVGFTHHHVEDLTGQGLRSHVLQAPGGLFIELLESLRDDSAVGSFLARRGPGLHHLCLEVSSLEDTLADPGVADLRLVNPEPQHDARGRRVFVHPASTGGVLLGLVEPHAER